MDMESIANKRPQSISYNCDKCEYKSKSKSGLIQHVDAKHNGICYNCEQCTYKSNWKGELTRHVELKHEGAYYKCDQCVYKSTRKYDLKRHIEFEHEGVRYDCDQCEYKSKRKYDLKVHVQTKHEGICYSCDHCGYKSQRKHTLKIHVESEHEGVYYYCKQCEYEFKTKPELKTHLKTKHEYTSSAKSNMSRHIEKQHTKIKLPKKINCEKVGKNKKNEEYVNNVKRPKMSESSGKLQITPVLGKKLPNSLNTETKKSNFQNCNFCKKSFEINDELQVHIEDQHEMVSCSSCSTSLPTKEDYFSHRQSKCLRQCLICEETFSGELLLNEHINGQQCQ